MSGHQRIYVVSTGASDTELVDVRRGVGRAPVVLTAPTAEAKRVVSGVGVEPRVEVLLAPVRFPPTDRGHRLDELVRRHALQDRFRDVVVVTDPASATLLLRVLAPDQLAAGGAVTIVGLARGDRPVPVRRALAAGVVLGLVAGTAEPLAPILLLPALTALVGLVLLLVPPARHLGRAALLAAAVALGLELLAIASSARFPGGW
ncbi:hypothetical protein H5V45_19195 [Nocardioides sp. KIGAM211]|uniref:Uncharacterized protein n=1 Tax=Nocardioides luti TaxID=2761101 RepID=A0A7X0VCG2_9ACTN|nr:hypothetical protein [Nocardioides luti]MBB6629460.1 hypothetical protein [Nocardioides luti]